MFHPAGSVGAYKGDFLPGWEVVYPRCSVILQCGGFIIKTQASLAQGCLSLILKVQATLTTEFVRQKVESLTGRLSGCLNYIVVGRHWLAVCNHAC